MDLTELNLQSLCRLCGNMNINLVPLFTDSGGQADLMEKITIHLKISISQEDALPKKLCIHCVNTLASWHSFYTSCQETCVKLEAMVKTSKQDEESSEQDPEFNEIIEYIENDQEDFGDCIEETVEHDDASLSPSLCLKESQLEDFQPEEEEGIKLDKSQFIRRCGWLQCSFCYLTFKLRKDFIKHLMEIHGYSKSVKTMARIRPKIDPEELKKSKIVKDGKTLYNCIDCGKNLHSVETFVFHRDIHTGTKIFSCHLCEKSFRIRQGLNLHLRAVHFNERRYQCDVCGQSFVNRGTAADHALIHTEHKPHVCEICGKAFKQKAGLYNHRKIHDPESKFTCDLCDRRFNARYALKLHMTIHTADKNHECEVCQKRFRLKTELSRHRTIHSDEKPFQCPRCSKTFRLNKYLLRHLKTTCFAEKKS